MKNEKLVSTLTWVLYFGAVLVLEQIFSNLIGAGQNEIVTILVTLALAALLAPLRTWLETKMEKRVNPQPKNVQQNVVVASKDNLVLRHTATYVVVLVLLVPVYFAAVILLQQVFAALVGQRSQLVTVLSTLVIVALFVPLRNRIQNALDRSFHHEKNKAGT